MLDKSIKPSDLGIIPNDWKRVKFGEITKVRQGLQIAISERLTKSTSTSLEYITIQSINKTNQDREYVESPSDRVICRTNDVLMTRTGNTGIVVTGVEGAFHNNFFLIDFKRNEIVTKFLVNYLRSKRVQHVLLTKAGTSTIPDLNHRDFYSIEFPLAPFREQQKIAQILSTWDKAIEKLEALITAKQKRKKALMQQLLAGKKRFAEFVKSEGFLKAKFGSIPTDWQYLHIAEVAKQFSVKNNDGHDLPVLSCTKHYGLVDSLSYFGKQIFSEDTSTYKVVLRNSFAYATNHIEEGSIGYQNLYDKALISPMYTVFQTNENINDEFLYRLLKTELYRHIFEVNTSASVDRRGSLRWDQFSAIKIPVPTIPEQQKIASFFAVTDTEIETYQKQLAALKEQKKGLMQQLLTGKKRVQIEIEV